MAVLPPVPQGRAPKPGAILAMCLAAGLAGGLLATMLTGLSAKFFLTGLMALAALIVLVIAGATGLLRILLLLALACGLSLNISITFLLHDQTPGLHQLNVSGAAGVTVTVVLIAAVLLLAQQMVARRRVILPVGLLWPWFLFAAVGVASLLVAVDARLVILELARLAVLLLIVVAIANLKPEEIRPFLLFLALFVAVQGAIAVTQFVTQRDLGLAFLGEEALAVETIEFRAQVRSTGTIGHPNILAYFFELLLPLMLAQLMMARTGLERLVYLVALVLGLGGILVTLSRAGWFTMALLLPLVVLFVGGRRLLTARALLVGAGLAVMLILAAALVGPLVLERLLGDDAGSYSHRATFNEGARDLISQSPWLGHGLNNFGPAFALFDTTGGYRVFREVNHVVHNMFLLVAGEVGLIGLGVFLLAFAVALWRCWRVFRMDPNGIAGTAALGIGAGLVAQLLHGLMDPGFRLSLPVSQLIFCLFGLIAALELHVRAARGKRR